MLVRLTPAAAWAAAVSLAIVLWATGCGGDTEVARVEAAVRALQDDLGAGRVADVCAAMSPRPARQIGSIGHGRRPTTCERDLRAFLESTASVTSGDGRRGLRAARRPEIVGVRVHRNGEAATVTFSLDGGDPFEVPFVKHDGDWRLDDFWNASAPPPRALR